MRRIRLLVGLGLALAPAVAVAEELAVRVAGATPFSRAELEEALRMRVPARHQVEVAGDRAGITVTVDGRSRSVVLGDERGAEAARVVALVAAALAVEGGPASGGVAVTPESEQQFDAGPAVLPAAGPVFGLPGRWQLGLRGAPAVGDDEVGGFGAVVAREGHGRRRLRASLGYENRGKSPELVGDDAINMHSLQVRFGLTMALDGRGRYGLSGAALVAPFVTRGGSGDAGVLVGGSAAVRVMIPLPSSDTDVMVEAGVDLMANQIEYRWDGAPALVTGRVRPWVVLGASWEDGR